MVLKIRMGKGKFISRILSNKPHMSEKDSQFGTAAVVYGLRSEFQSTIFWKTKLIFLITENGGRGRIRTDERTKRADLQSASFSHLDTLPTKVKEGS